MKKRRYYILGAILTVMLSTFTLSSAKYGEVEVINKKVETRIPIQPRIVFQVDTTQGRTYNRVQGDESKLINTNFYAFQGSYESNKDDIMSTNIRNAIKIPWVKDLDFSEHLKGEYSIVFYDNFSKLGLDMTNVPDDSNGASYYLDEGLKDIPYYNVKLSETTNFNGGLYNAVNVTSVTNINSWDTEEVTNMEDLFGYAKAFNSSISNWNVSNVTNFKNTFRGAIVFNQSLENWNVSSAVNLEKMFWSAESFNKPVGNWDTSSAVNMIMMFENAFRFNQYVGDWDVSNVEYMIRMFRTSSKYEPGDYAQDMSKWDISNVRDVNRDNIDELYDGFRNNSNVSDEQLPIDWRPIRFKNVTLNANETYDMSLGNEASNELSSWKQKDNPTLVTKLSNYIIDGKQWLRMTANSHNNTYAGMSQVINNFEPGVDYVFSYTARTVSGEGNVRTEIQQYGVDGNGPQYGEIFEVNTTPSRHHVTFRTTSRNKDEIEFIILGQPDKSAFDLLISDVVIEKSKYKHDIIETQVNTITKDPKYHKLKYNFLGWNTKVNGTGDNFNLGVDVMPNEDITLYAQWEKKIATVNYVYNGSIISTSKINALTQDNFSENLLEIPSGYRLIKDISNIIINYNEPNLIELEKIRTLNVNPNDDSTIQYLNEIEDPNFTKGLGGFGPAGGLPSGSLSQYNTDGRTWLRLKNDGNNSAKWPAAAYSTEYKNLKHGQRYTFSATVKNISNTPVKFRTIIHTRGGADNDPQPSTPYIVIQPGETTRVYNTYVATTNTSKHHFYLQLVAQASTEGPSDLLFTNVSFNHSQLSNPTSTKVVGEKITLPTLTRDGYELVGLYDNPEGTGTKYNSSSLMPDKDLTLYAKWTPITVSYTFELDSPQRGVGSSNKYGFGLKKGIMLHKGTRYYVETSGSINQEAKDNGNFLITHLYKPDWSEATSNSISKVASDYDGRGYGSSQFTSVYGGEYYLNNYMYNNVDPSGGTRKGLVTVHSTRIMQNITGDGGIWKYAPIGSEIVLPKVAMDKPGLTGYWKDPTTGIIHKPGDVVKLTSGRMFYGEWK